RSVVCHVRQRGTPSAAGLRSAALPGSRLSMDSRLLGLRSARLLLDGRHLGCFGRRPIGDARAAITAFTQAPGDLAWAITAESAMDTATREPALRAANGADTSSSTTPPPGMSTRST